MDLVKVRNAILKQRQIKEGDLSSKIVTEIGVYF